MSYLIKLELDDGSEIVLGGSDEFFVTPAEGNKSVTMDDGLIELIGALQKVQEENQ